MFKPAFPCDFTTFLQTLTQVFADKELKKLDSLFDDVKEQLENSTTHVNLLNLKTLTNEELLNLSKVLKECQTKGMDAEDHMKALFGEFKLLSEDN